MDNVWLKSSILALLVVLCSAALGQNFESKDSISAHLDLAYLEQGVLKQDIYMSSLFDKTVYARAEVFCYQYKGEGDSIRLYQHFSKIDIKNGYNAMIIRFDDTKSKYQADKEFIKVMQNVNTISPGIYKIYLRVDSIEGQNKGLNTVFYYEIDSIINKNSALYLDLQNIAASIQMQNSEHTALKKKNYAQAKTLWLKKLERQLSKRGLAFTYETLQVTDYIILYLDNKYLGKVDLQKLYYTALGGNEFDINNLNINNQLGNYTSLQSQFKALSAQSKSQKDVTGLFSLSSYLSNSPMPNSAQEKNYYEARGALSATLLGVPVEITGYYTSQDQERQAKSSFMHLRYDAEKAKSELAKLIASFNNKYQQVFQNGVNYNMIYGEFLSTAEKNKGKLLNKLQKELGVDSTTVTQLNEEDLKKLLRSKVDSNATGLDSTKAKIDSLKNTVNNTADLLKNKQEQIAAQYAVYKQQIEKVKELEGTIKRYSLLLNQYKNTHFFDSLSSYQQLKDVKDWQNMSYKDMAKKASNILPDGSYKGVLQGLTNVDVGMFPKYASEYTLSGQMMKGVDLGYDIGIATLSGSYGKMEYIDRSGNVEDYKMYSFRNLFKPIKKQQIGLIYYGYSPGQQLLGSDGFFKDVNVSLPSFRNPVHILSGTYSGKVSSMVGINAEFAHAIVSGQSKEAAAIPSFLDKSAYSINVNTDIVSPDLMLEATYEHTGKSFVNNTMPVMMTGTDRLQLSGRTSLFQSFLSVGLEYNYLLNHNLYGKSNNTKWGFSVATHSKRYPSVSLSYKPFSTFRAINDTFSIAQKPITGAVWIGKVNYQYKRHQKILRLTLIFNRNNSINDTITYASATTQLNTIYTQGSTSYMLGLGYSSISTDIITTTYPIFNKSYFANGCISGSLTDWVQVSGGADIAFTTIGLSKYGAFGSINYMLKRMPIQIRILGRYSNFKLAELASWTPIYSGQLEFIWNFKTKLLGK